MFKILKYRIVNGGRWNTTYVSHCKSMPHFTSFDVTQWSNLDHLLFFLLFITDTVGCCLHQVLLPQYPTPLTCTWLINMGYFRIQLLKHSSECPKRQRTCRVLWHRATHGMSTANLVVRIKSCVRPRYTAGQRPTPMLRRQNSW